MRICRSKIFHHLYLTLKIKLATFCNFNLFFIITIFIFYLIIRREIARSRAQVLEINQFLDLQREDFEELLASRPEDLIFLMETQAQDKSRGDYLVPLALVCRLQ